MTSVNPSGFNAAIEINRSLKRLEILLEDESIVRENDTVLEHYLELEKLFEAAKKTLNDTELKQYLKQQELQYGKIIKTLQDIYKQKSLRAKLQARQYRAKNLKEAAESAGKEAQSYIQESQFLMKGLGDLVCNHSGIEYKINGNHKLGIKSMERSSQLTAAAARVFEIPIEEED